MSIRLAPTDHIDGVLLNESPNRQTSAVGSFGATSGSDTPARLGLPPSAGGNLAEVGAWLSDLPSNRLRNVRCLVSPVPIRYWQPSCSNTP